jgi:hypothetical protein
MEGIALATEFIGSVIAYLGGVALLAFVVSVILFGYMAEEESRGNRLLWAEWPLPEADEGEEEEEIRLAA